MTKITINIKPLCTWQQRMFTLQSQKCLAFFGPHVVTAFLDGLKDGNPFVGNGFVRSTTLFASYDKSHEAGVGLCMEATYC